MFVILNLFQDLNKCIYFCSALAENSGRAGQFPRGQRPIAAGKLLCPSPPDGEMRGEGEKEMNQVLAQKNNKVGHEQHIFRMVSPSGEVRGTLILIEARSFRSKWSNGTNAWDIFVAEDGVPFSVKSCGRNDASAIAAYCGEYFHIVEKVEVDTPLGKEVLSVPLTPGGVPLAEATPEEVKLAARAALYMVGCGWGPHGEIRNADALRKWASDIVGDQPPTTY